MSILIQDGNTGEPLRNLLVWVEAAPRDRPDQAIARQANSDLATNKLMSAAFLDLSMPGWWHFLVRVEDGNGRTEFGFDLEVGEPLPEWFWLAGWIAWPLAAIVLYAIHRLLVHRKERRGLRQPIRARPGSIDPEFS